MASLADAQRRWAPGSQPPGEWPAELGAEVLERYAGAESGETIAEPLELASSSVYRVLEECTLSSGSGVLRSHGEAGRVRTGCGGPPAGPGKASGSLPVGVVEQATALYLADDSPRLIGP